MSSDTLGVVLAGGASRRMGRDKAALELHGRPLVAWVTDALRSAFREVVIVGPAHRAELVPEVPIIADAFPGQGPLGGIATALAHAGPRRVFVAACDMPFLSTALARYLASVGLEAAAVVPRSERGMEPLCAAYGHSCHQVAKELLAGGDPSMADLLARVTVRVVEPEDWRGHDPSGRSLVNLNTPEEWEAARRGLLWR